MYIRMCLYISLLLFQKTKNHTDASWILVIMLGRREGGGRERERPLTHHRGVLA